LLPVYLSQNLVLFSIHIEVAHALSTESILQCLSDIACADTQHGCFITVDDDSGFRFCEFQIHVGHLEVGALVYLLHERWYKLLQLLNVGRLQHILYGHARTASAESGLLLHECTRSRFITHTAGNICGNFHLRPFTFGHVRQHQTHHAKATACKYDVRLPLGCD